jgi:HEAT repeat protein
MVKDMVTQLIEELEAEDEATRLQAVQRLGALGPRAARAVPALVATAGERSNQVATAANGAIGEIGAPGIPYLLRIIRNPLADEFRGQVIAFADEDEFRSYAANALADMGSIALPQLMRLIEDEDPVVRDLAIEAIPRVGVAVEKAVPKLADTLRDTRFAHATALSLAQIAGRAAKPEESEAFKVLLAAVKDKDVTLRRTAVPAFEFMGERAAAALPALIKACRDPDQQVREAAESLLKRLREEAKQWREKS